MSRKEEKLGNQTNQTSELGAGGTQIKTSKNGAGSKKEQTLWINCGNLDKKGVVVAVVDVTFFNHTLIHFFTLRNGRNIFPQPRENCVTRNPLKRGPSCLNFGLGHKGNISICSPSLRCNKNDDALFPNQQRRGHRRQTTGNPSHGLFKLSSFLYIRIIVKKPFPPYRKKSPSPFFLNNPDQTQVHSIKIDIV